MLARSIELRRSLAAVLWSFKLFMIAIITGLKRLNSLSYLAAHQ
jgi:hypothetical protein